MFRIIAFVAAAVLSLPTAVFAAEYSGVVMHVKDGDTFSIREPASGKRIDVRLCGVDSPERGKKGYFDAKLALTALIKDKGVRCVQVGPRAGTPCDGRSRPNNRNRIVAQCFIDGKDVAAEMIRSGMACDWTKFSAGHYKFEPSTCARSN